MEFACKIGTADGETWVKAGLRCSSQAWPLPCWHLPTRQGPCLRRAAQSSFYPRFTVRGANLTRKFHALWRKIFASLRLRGESYAAFSADMQRHEESLRRFLVA